MILMLLMCWLPAGEELLCAAAACWVVGVWAGPGPGGGHRHVPVQVRLGQPEFTGCWV
jgi:hypothetical protein